MRPVAVVAPRGRVEQEALWNCVRRYASLSDDLAVEAEFQLAMFMLKSNYWRMRIAEIESQVDVSYMQCIWKRNDKRTNECDVTCI